MKYLRFRRELITRSVNGENLSPIDYSSNPTSSRLTCLVREMALRSGSGGHTYLGRFRVRLAGSTPDGNLEPGYNWTIWRIM